MPLTSCSVDLDEVCILFLDDIVGQNHGHITLERTALWSQALSVQLFSLELLTLDDLHLPRMAHALSLFTETVLQAPTEEGLLFLQP